jgi:head-tail joining protein
MPAGDRRHLVTLVDEPEGKPATPMVPSTAYASRRQLGTSAGAENAVAYEVGLPYHPQIDTDTVLVFEDGRELEVMDVNDVDGRHRDLVLLCQEVRTP